MPAPSSALAPLRARIRALERLKPAPAGTLAVHPAIDVAVPLACLHQIVAEDTAATGFAARLAGALADRVERPVLWVSAGEDLYPPGLAAFGLPSRHLILAHPRPADLLWTLEEALKCPDLAAVVGEIGALDLTAGRRLQLAAEAVGVTGFVLHPPAARAANAGTTRWRVGSAPGGRWRLALERSRQGRTGAWVVTP